MDFASKTIDCASKTMKFNTMKYNTNAQEAECFRLGNIGRCDCSEIFCIKNDEFFIENDECFCIKIDE